MSGNNVKHNYLDFNKIVSNDDHSINYAKIHDINGNEYSKITKNIRNKHVNNIGIIIKKEPLLMLIFDDVNNKHDIIRDNRNKCEYISIDDYKYIDKKIYNEYNLFKYYVNYLKCINNKENKIHKDIFTKFIKYIYGQDGSAKKFYGDLSKQKHYTITYWLHNIIANDYMYDYKIKQNFIYGQQKIQKMFLIKSKYSNKANCKKHYNTFEWDNNEYDGILIRNFVNSLIEYTRAFYNNIIGWRECPNCLDRITINTYGFNDWEYCNFIYPTEFKECKTCGTRLKNSNYCNTMVSNERYDNIMSRNVNSQAYLSRLINIMSKPFVNIDTGAYNYKLLKDYCQNSSYNYTFIDILNDYNTFLKKNLKYTYLLFVKRKYLIRCDMGKCSYINNIYRDRSRKSIPAVKVLVSKIHMSMHHFDLYKKRRRNYTNDNNKFSFMAQYSIKNIKDTEVKSDAINELINNNNYNEYKYGDDTSSKSQSLMYYKIPVILYQTFYHEILSNKIHSITYSDFIDELNKAKLLLKTKDVQSFEANDGALYYGLLHQDPIKISNILAILLYCNFTQLCEKFRKEFFLHKFTKYYSIKQRNKRLKAIESLEYYYFGRNLYIAIEYFGVKSNNDYNSDNNTFYTGLNSKFLFEKYGHTFDLPLSVTEQSEVAANFAKNGIIIRIKAKWKYIDNILEKRNNNTRYMSLKLLSDYGEFENECLYFGGHNELRIIDIIDLSDKTHGSKLTQYIKTLNWLDKTINNEWKYDKYANLLSLILTKKEQSILLKILRFIVNNGTILDNIPVYIQHLYQYFCLKQSRINFDNIHSDPFIYKFKEFMLLFLNDNCKYTALGRDISMNEGYYFPINKIKIKKLFKNIESFYVNFEDETF